MSLPDTPFDTRDYRPGDAPSLIRIFRDAIASATEHYDATQRTAWASAADDAAAFEARLDEGWIRIAFDAQGPAGFAQLNVPGHLVMLYVAQRTARQGVATLLMDDMHALAGAMAAKEITAEASLCALPFFLSQGFEDEGQESVERAGVMLSRHRMRLKL